MVKSGIFSAALMAMMVSTAQANQDPTAPLGWQAPAKKQTSHRARLPDLQSIICAEESNCTVIMNDVAIGLGGRVSGYTLSEINNDHVTVTRGGKQWRLELFAENIKTN